MGDRALVIFANDQGQSVSPTVYLHWSGSAVPDLIEKLSVVMGTRKGDVSYACARFAAIACDDNPGNLSVGVLQTPQEVTIAASYIASFPDAAGGVALDNSRKVLRKYSHGDAGVILVNVSDFTWQAFGGYLAENIDA